MMQHINDYTDN